MTGATQQVSNRALKLRQDFDRGFAAAPTIADDSQEDLIAIRIGAHRFALRLSEVAGLYADKRITRVPGANATMLGIAGFRGTIAPVYDFASLLGHGRGHAPRWLIVAASTPIALAFEAFDGQLRISNKAITPQQSRSGAHGFMRDFIEAGNILRPVIDLQLVIESVKT